MLPGQHTAGAPCPQAAQRAAQHLPPLAIRNTEQAMPQGRRTWVRKSLPCSSTSRLCAVQQETMTRPPRRTNSTCSRGAGVAPPWSRDVGCGRVPRDTCSRDQQSEDCASKASGVVSPKGTDAPLRLFGPWLWRKDSGPQSNRIHRNRQPPLFLPSSSLGSHHWPLQTVQRVRGRRTRRSRKHSE